MEIKNVMMRLEKVQALLFAIEAVQEGRDLTAVKILRSITGLPGRELSSSIAIARGAEPQGEVSGEAREVGLLLKRFL